MSHATLSVKCSALLGTLGYSVVKFSVSLRCGMSSLRIIDTICLSFFRYFGKGCFLRMAYQFFDNEADTLSWAIELYMIF